MRPFSAQALFLDFDGVLCDSLEECYRSSWLASRDGEFTEPPADPTFDSAYRRRFDACRPFVRSGEDYLIAHEWAASGRIPDGQSQFDESLKAAGTEALATRKAALYRVRDALLASHRPQWLSWNPLYPGIAEALRGQVNNPWVWILSTKKAEFIVEILAHQGVRWPLERTLYTGTNRKLDMIRDLHTERPSLLIDDQIDHLDFSDRWCRCYLALWGYADPASAALAKATLTLTQACALIKAFPQHAPRGE